MGAVAANPLGYSTGNVDRHAVEPVGSVECAALLILPVRRRVPIHPPELAVVRVIGQANVRLANHSFHEQRLNQDIVFVRRDGREISAVHLARHASLHEGLWSPFTPEDK